jgi:hypothetical protein
MAKNRKTKKEKLRAAKRLSAAPSSDVLQGKASPHSTPVTESVFTFTGTTDTTSAPIQSKTISETSHLREDLMRTGIVTGAIILAEIILFITLTMR